MGWVTSFQKRNSTTNDEGKKKKKIGRIINDNIDIIVGYFGNGSPSSSSSQRYTIWVCASIENEQIKGNLFGFRQIKDSIISGHFAFFLAVRTLFTQTHTLSSVQHVNSCVFHFVLFSSHFAFEHSTMCVCILCWRPQHSVHLLKLAFPPNNCLTKA